MQTLRGVTRNTGLGWASGPLALLLLQLLLQPAPATAGTWLLQNGKEYYGELESYDFQAREIVLRKADGKPFAFPARELAFGAKTKLLFSPGFLRSLKDYRRPLLPLLGYLAALAAGILAPLFVALVGSAHALGVAAPTRDHLLAFLKVSALAALMGVGCLAVAAQLDPGLPLLPDTNADLVLTLTSLNCGVFFCSLLLSIHYRRSFWKGMAITLLTGVCCTILWAAGGLSLLYLATRRDIESFVTRFVFEPLQWF